MGQIVLPRCHYTLCQKPKTSFVSWLINLCLQRFLATWQCNSQFRWDLRHPFLCLDNILTLKCVIQLLISLVRVCGFVLLKKLGSKGSIKMYSEHKLKNRYRKQHFTVGLWKVIKVEDIHYLLACILVSI